jgi:hypothetical protein
VSIVVNRREPRTGLSRRRPRVRVPSLPSLEVPANRQFRCLLRHRRPMSGSTRAAVRCTVGAGLDKEDAWKLAILLVADLYATDGQERPWARRASARQRNELRSVQDRAPLMDEIVGAQHAIASGSGRRIGGLIVRTRSQARRPSLPLNRGRHFGNGFRLVEQASARAHLPPIASSCGRRRERSAKMIRRAPKLQSWGDGPRT